LDVPTDSVFGTVPSSREERARKADQCSSKKGFCSAGGKGVQQAVTMFSEAARSPQLFPKVVAPLPNG